MKVRHAHVHVCFSSDFFPFLLAPLVLLQLVYSLSSLLFSSDTSSFALDMSRLASSPPSAGLKEKLTRISTRSLLSSSGSSGAPTRTFLQQANDTGKHIARMIVSAMDTCASTHMHQDTTSPQVPSLTGSGSMDVSYEPVQLVARMHEVRVNCCQQR